MRKITRRKRKQSFIQFTETLNRDTPIGHIWNVVRKFARSAAGENRHATENSLTPSYIPENNNRIGDTNQEQSPLFTVEELMVELEKKKETAPGIDQISYSMIKKLPENMIIKPVHFYNSILRGTMNVPEEWKTRTVIPTLKRDKDLNKYDSYRPLVLAPCACKLFESTLKNRIEHKLENEKFFGDRFQKRVTPDPPTIQYIYTESLAEQGAHADDLALVISHRDPAVLLQTMDQTLDNVNTWLYQHGIKISASKSKAIIFSKRALRTPLPQLKLENTIDWAHTYKYLGVIDL
ncbi:hypothetical protein JTB14_012875 [Gonioctena quinquepunctata]|nr:hypothetical protein JTB14_012875 [Gonioctena quinquepunctata]